VAPDWTQVDLPKAWPDRIEWRRLSELLRLWRKFSGRLRDRRDRLSVPVHRRTPSRRRG
jgi:hypothetical protein